MRSKFSLTLLLITLGAGALLVGGTSCSRAPQVPPKEVRIKGDDKMKYDVANIDAKPGQKISVTLSNVGTAPKASMGHNFIVLKQNVNVPNFLEAGSMQAANDYIAPETTKDIIAHTKLLGPGESDMVVFTAPYVPGDYVYLCSFPGHYAAGMTGILSVKQ